VLISDLDSDSFKSFFFTKRHLSLSASSKHCVVKHSFLNYSTKSFLTTALANTASWLHSIQFITSYSERRRWSNIVNLYFPSKTTR